MQQQMPYPPEVPTVWVRATLPAFGAPGSAKYRVLAERQFGYTGTDFIFFSATPWRAVKGGKLAVELPFSDAPGLLGDRGQPLTKPVGYRIELLPTQSGKIEIRAWQTLLMADGPERDLVELADLGGWPNATIVTGPTIPNPTDPTDDDDLQLVEKSPGVWGFPDSEVI